MKKFSNILIAGAVAALSLTSCQRDLTSLNDDPKHPSVVLSQSLLATAQYQASYYMTTGSVNFNNYRFFVQSWAETTYIDESNYDLITRNQPRNNWNRMYVFGLKNLEQAKINLKEEVNSVAVQKNRNATLELSQIFIWENLVDTYGDIPYFDALKTDKDILAPKYDDSKAIYTDLLTRINAAIASIDLSQAGYGNGGDLIYQGDMTKWKHFANSLKLRLAMNLADVDPAASKLAAEQAIAGGVISSESESYKFIFDTATFTSPIYDDLVASGRNDFIPTQLVVNTMNSTSDPRRHSYFSENLATATVEEQSTVGSEQTLSLSEIPADVAVGMRVYSYNAVTEESAVYYGKVSEINDDNVVVSLANPAVKAAVDGDVSFGFYKGGTFGSKNAFGARTHMSNLLRAKAAPANLLGYSEVLFLASEAAARGYNVGATAESYYKQAVSASMSEFGVSDADILEFLAANPYNATDWKASIGVQSWIALYNSPFAAWNFTRRLDKPGFVNPPNSKTEGVPVRMLYSDQEYVLNGANVKAAAAKMGGDKVTSKLFWDVH